jgi:hypothetical protein
MKFSDAVNLPLRWFGLKLVKLSSLKAMQSASANALADIHRDKTFMELFRMVEPFTMTGLERSYALYKALQFLHQHKVMGDLVECGVWRGGSCMLMSYFFQSVGDTSRRIFLYDTFEGMTRPSEADGDQERREWEQQRTTDDSSTWCLSPLDEVKENMRRTGYPEQQLFFVKGKVEDTLPGTLPGEISLLRLDTDWYASTLHELQHLFPLLVKNGFLLIDDYGVWQGAQKATDEYFNCSPYFLQRIDSSGRLLIKG